MKFRKKPIVIEAAQWFPPGDERHDPSATPVWRRQVEGETAPEGAIILQHAMPPFFSIRTLEGPMQLTPGDWVITGVKGEKYPCKPDIFAATYDPANVVE